LAYADRGSAGNLGGIHITLRSRTSRTVSPRTNVGCSLMGISRGSEPSILDGLDAAIQDLCVQTCEFT
jgi:hypothetical protein